MPLKSIFTGVKGERNIANYDFTELMTGRGIQTIYLCTATDAAAATTYKTIDQKGFSQDIFISVNIPANTGAFTKLSDLDYDMYIDLPRNVKGDCMITTSTTNSLPAGFVKEAYMIFKIRRWDGAIETEIASAQTATQSGGAAAKILACFFTIPFTHFKKGEYLRITIETWGKNTDPNNAWQFIYGIDPKDRAGPVGGAQNFETSSSSTIAYIPFIIDQ